MATAKQMQKKSREALKKKLGEKGYSDHYRKMANLRHKKNNELSTGDTCASMQNCYTNS